MIDWLGWLMLMQAILSQTGPVPTTVAGGQGGGRTYCYAYGPTITFGGQPATGIHIHEYLHAYDCVDNGAMDGSPLPQDYARQSPDPAHLWVYWAMSNPKEAAAIVRRGP